MAQKFLCKIYFFVFDIKNLSLRFLAPSLVNYLQTLDELLVPFFCVHGKKTDKTCYWPSLKVMSLKAIEIMAHKFAHIITPFKVPSSITLNEHLNRELFGNNSLTNPK